MATNRDVEEENFVRFTLLVTGISPRAVRSVFDSLIPPASLTTRLQTDINIVKGLLARGIISQTQWNTLFPTTNNPHSSDFDVTLMICLLTNLIGIPRHLRDPQPTDITLGADLYRIRKHRNHLAHLTDNKIANQYFEPAWIELTEVSGRLGGVVLEQECKVLKVKTLDQSNREILLEVSVLRQDIKNVERSHSNLVAQYETLKNDFGCLKAEHDEKAKKLESLLSDNVPQNIRGLINSKLEEWKTDDEEFIETIAAKHVLQCIKEQACVRVTGSSGMGKTFTIRHVALKMADGGYEILPVTNPDDIIKYHNPNGISLFVIDNFCGTFSLSARQLDEWKTVAPEIEMLLEKKLVKIIIACRLQVSQDEYFKTLSLFNTCECNLLSGKLRLTSEEQTLIAEAYLGSEAHTIRPYMNRFHCFPLLCQLYKANTNRKAINFFRSPFTVFKNEIDQLYADKAYEKYCVLALCVMFGNCIPENWLSAEEDVDTHFMLEATLQACKLPKGTSKLVLRDAINSLNHTYFKKPTKLQLYPRSQPSFYRTIHDTIFDFLVHYFSNVMLRCLVMHADSQLVSNKFVFEVDDTNDELMVLVPLSQVDLYFKRLTDEWLRGNFNFIFENVNIKIEKFRKMLLQFLKTIKNSIQNQLATAFSATPNTDSVLMHCCKLGDANMVRWCIFHGADVNNSIASVKPLSNVCSNVNKRTAKILKRHKFFKRMWYSQKGKSPLSVACKNGSTEIVNVLLTNKANVNHSSCDGQSPLYISCNNEDTKLICLLLNNGADINQCRQNGESPLYAGCKIGNSEVVKILLDNGADMNKCTLNEESPLYAGCKTGNTEVVKILLDNGADMNQCTLNGKSPLYAGCKIGNTEVVKISLDNGADMNKCTLNGESPLYAGCKTGNTEVVKILLDSGADINLCTLNGESPLYAGCNIGNTEVVKILLDNGADMNQRTKMGRSPLFAGCLSGNADVVRILLANGVNVDINHCLTSGKSLLHSMCTVGNADIVKILLENGADLNPITFDAWSSLFAGCLFGRKKIVQILLDYGVDTRTCTPDGISLLHIVCGVHRQIKLKMHCRNGKSIYDTFVDEGSWSCYVEIARLLLQSKTCKSMVNLCTTDGKSPLYFACFHGDKEIVELLLESNANIGICAREICFSGRIITHFSPMHVAYKAGHTEIVKILLVNNADIHKCTGEGESPLFEACCSRTAGIELIQLLVDNGANVNQCNSNGESPLLAAVLHGGIEKVKYLLENNADIALHTTTGQSPLYAACSYALTRTCVVELLLDYNAEINQSTNNKETPLFAACLFGQTEKVRLLLNNNVDLNKCTKDGRTVLYAACLSGKIDTVELILDSGVDPNIGTTDGQTPLYVACCYPYTNKNIIKMILKYKTEIKQCIINSFAWNLINDGNSIRDISLLYNKVDIKMVLLNAEIKKLSDRNNT